MSRELTALYRDGSLVGLSDRQVLERFRSALAKRDQGLAEAALGALVDRHSAMVWNVCRSMIRDPHDAEDAFQATFLILVRKAGTLRIGETVGPWLHVVAYRTAASVRASAARRRQVERSAAGSIREAADPAGPDEVDEIRASIHAAIADLPESFRKVVVLCDLEGLSYLEAAHRLGLPLGTVQSRLARARRRLRRDLERNDMHPTDPGGAGLMAIGGPPASLAARVGRIGALIATDPGCLSATVAGPVRSLIEGGLQSMFLGNLGRALVASSCIVFCVGTFWYAEARSGRARPGAPPSGALQAEPKVVVPGRVEIPAPRRLAVAAGRGRTIVFARDEKGKRIRVNPDAPDSPFRQVERDIHWAVIAGVMDHDRVMKALIAAHRKPVPPDKRLYCRVELKRQAMRPDGTWSEWSAVNMDANYGVLDEVPYREEERIPESFRDDNLVDLLPFLSQGEWRGVDIEEFVPAGAEVRKDRPIVQPPHQGPRQDRPPVLMVRTLDFTVEPGRTYRYCARVELFNPHYDRAEDRGKPANRKFLFGPWSEATGSVTIPAP